MAVPKRKSSKSKIRTRRRAHKGSFTTAGACSECGAPQEPHRACPSCGYYRGRQVLSVESK
jgi:large subunit ribosomal protein L32